MKRIILVLLVFALLPGALKACAGAKASAHRYTEHLQRETP